MLEATEPLNPHSDLPPTGGISIEIPEPAATDKPLPFGVCRGQLKKPPAAPPEPATGLAPVV